MQDHYEGEGNEGYEGEIPQTPNGEIPDPFHVVDPDYEVDPPETEDPMVEVSMSELANLRMLLEEAMDALANVVDSGMGMGDLIEKPLAIPHEPIPLHGEESEVGPPPEYNFGPDDIVDYEDELPVTSL